MKKYIEPNTKVFHISLEQQLLTTSSESLHSLNYNDWDGESDWGISTNSGTVGADDEIF